MLSDVQRELGIDTPASRVRFYTAVLLLAVGVGLLLLLGFWRPDKWAVYIAVPALIVMVIVSLVRAMREWAAERTGDDVREAPEPR